MTQAVSSRSPTAKVLFQSKTNQFEFYGGQSCTGTGFSPNTSVSPVSNFPPIGAPIIGHEGPEGV